MSTLWCMSGPVVNRVVNRAEYLKQLGELIKAERSRQQLTQDALALKSAVHQSVISYLERGQEDIGVYKLYRVLAALGLELAVVPTE